MPPQTPFSGLDRKLIIVGLLFLTVGLLIGLAIGRSISPSATNTAARPAAIDQTLKRSDNNLVVNQTATIQGVIKSINGSIITVQGPDNQTSDVNLSPDLLIYTFKDNNSPSTVSSDPKTLLVNQAVIISLNLKNDKYVATSITYGPPTKAPVSAH